jgi:SAM-dependent methyltransferase
VQRVLTLALAALLLAPAARAQEEVPFVTTPDRVTLAMLELAGVGPADHVIDLGSGDGRIVITAARRFGASGLGVEIVPELVAKSRANARAAGVADRAEFREQDLFRTELARASVITIYLLPEVNLQLRPRLLALAPGTRIVSHDWDLGDWLPERTITIDVPDKPVGREKVSRVHLWIVPVRIGGAWCAAGAARAAGARLEIVQRFQLFSAVLHSPGAAPPTVFDGRIEGRTLHGNGRAPPLRLAGDALVLEAPTAAAAQRFTRCA